MNVLLPYWSHPYGGEHHKLFERNKVKKMEEKLFLGIEGSSQSTTAVVIDGKNVVHRESVKYDDIQPPGYILKDGFWELEGNVVLGSPVVWTMGLDHILTGIPKEMRKNIAAVSGSGQQHGSVLLRMPISTIVNSLDPSQPLTGQLIDRFAFTRTDTIRGDSRYTAAVWKDSSTTSQMEEIIEAVGGSLRIVDLTGGGAFERLTGPQIRKFEQMYGNAWHDTKEVHLVSSFHYGLLTGQAKVDPGDAGGMMLMNVDRRAWSKILTRATATNLLIRLPNIGAADQLSGATSNYIVNRFGLDASVAPFSGDNPNSLVGVVLTGDGDIGISLGTSDTVFGSMGASKKWDYSGGTCVFGDPKEFNHNMYLACWKNGSTVREKIAKEFGMDWAAVSQYLLDTNPDPKKMAVYWHEAEIAPKTSKPLTDRSPGFENGDMYNIKAMVEYKIFSMMAKLEAMGIEPKRLFVTAGASDNDGLVQTIADITGKEVYRRDVSDSATLGAALRARHAYLNEDQPTPWNEVLSPFETVSKTFTPNSARHAVYQGMFEAYKQFEAAAAAKAR
ncbi:MAG TPA: FGGY family carbohydrate kinase [Candidatus Nanoarchaeia archaeon]|nr:FGGY family carbohydrate kinase [Candidatus Nanoarchaeia archaeon]